MYLDHNAGGRVRPEVALAVEQWLQAGGGNPASLHSAGRRARDAVERARERIAVLVGARTSDVVFTSGGTEANNLAILGRARPGAHFVSTSIEHASVLRALDAAATQGSEVTLLAPDREGRIATGDLARAVRTETVLVSIGWANGEIGTIQPIAELSRSLREEKQNASFLLHSDAVQAASLCEIDIAEAGVDLLSLSGHKLGALPGVGALIVRDGAALKPLLHGGPQERERRAGTENVPGIVGFGVAAELAFAERAARAKQAVRVKRRLWEVLAARAAPVARHDPEDAVPNTLSVAFPGLRGDALVVALDLRGIAASTGSACAAGAPEPSHVLRAIGCDVALAKSTVRLSFGAELSLEDAERAAGIIADVVARARRALGSSAEALRDAAI